MRGVATFFRFGEKLALKVEEGRGGGGGYERVD